MVDQDKIPFVFPVLLRFFFLFAFFGIKITFIPLLFDRDVLLLILSTAIAITSFHFPVYQLEIYYKSKDPTTILVNPLIFETSNRVAIFELVQYSPTITIFD